MRALFPGTTIVYTIVLTSGPHVGIGVSHGNFLRILHFDEGGVHEDSVVDEHSMNDLCSAFWGRAFSMDLARYGKIRAEIYDMFPDYSSGENDCRHFVLAVLEACGNFPQPLWSIRAS